MTKRLFEGLSINGYAIFDPRVFPEVDEIVAVVRSLPEVPSEPEEGRHRHKPFLVSLELEDKVSEAVGKLACREDVLECIQKYIRPGAYVKNIDVYKSEYHEEPYRSSQLYHCDGDYTPQVKLFVLCSKVGPENGPLTFVQVDDTRHLWKRLCYNTTQRLKDKQVNKKATQLLGDPGTCCFIDTSMCFHYGSRVQQNADPRLVTVVQYV